MLFIFIVSFSFNLLFYFKSIGDLSYLLTHNPLGGFMKKQHTLSLTEGPVTLSLVQFTFPILVAMALQLLYGATDMFIVGNFGTVSDVSGISTSSQLMNLLTSLCTGLATGATIYIGQKIGQKKDHEVSGIIVNAVSLFMLISLAIMSLLLIFKPQLLTLLNTPSNALRETSDYLFYCSLGIPMIFAYNILGSIFRGLGDSKTPMVAVGIACVINIILDLILVAGFGLGAAGAAMATVCAQTISVILSLLIVRQKQLFKFAFHGSDLKFQKVHITRVLSLGIPVALQSMLVSFSFLMITVIINDFGVVFSAAVGLSEKITGLIMLVPLAFMQSLSVYVAQNVGSEEHERAKKALISAMLISIVFGVVMATVAFFQGEYLARLFSQDTAVIAETVNYLKSYAFDTLLVPVLFCLTGYFNGYGKTFFVMIQGVVSSLFIRVPLAFLFSQIVPTSLFIIGLATPTATFIQIIACILYYFFIRKKLHLGK